MKTVTLAFLTCAALALPVAAEPRRPGKAPAATSGSKSIEKLSPPKSKLIDMSGPSPSGDELISTDLGGKDVEFFLAAYELGKLETWLGAQAKAKGEADKVRVLGDALQSTQVEENEMLAKLSQQKGVSLSPAKEEEFTPKALAAEFGKLHGPEFDTAIMDRIAKATERAVETYQQAAQSQDKEIQQFARQILPMAQEKLALANKVAGRAGASGGKPGFRENIPVVPQERPATLQSATEASRPAIGKDPSPGHAGVTRPAPARSVPAATPPVAASSPSASPATTAPAPGATPPPRVKPTPLPFSGGGGASPMPSTPSPVR